MRMDAEKNFDVFISYRRKNQPIYAQLLYVYLKAAGYRVFLDVQGLGSGHYDEQLYAILDEISDLVLVLPEGALERCREPGDWICKEVAYALRNGKNVVPFFAECRFPDNIELPEELEPLRTLQSTRYDAFFFEESLDRVKKYLVSRPVGAKTEPEPVKETKPAEQEKKPLPPVDVDSLEPEVKIEPVEPSGRRLGRPAYTPADMRRAKEDLRKQLTDCMARLTDMLREDEVESNSVYRSAKTAMILARELMGAYNWPYELDMARGRFMSIYEPILLRLQTWCEQGNPTLSEEMVQLLKRYRRGLQELINSLNG